MKIKLSLFLVTLTLVNGAFAGNSPDKKTASEAPKDFLKDLQVVQTHEEQIQMHEAQISAQLGDPVPEKPILLEKEIGSVGSKSGGIVTVKVLAFITSKNQTWKVQVKNDAGEVWAVDASNINHTPISIQANLTNIINHAAEIVTGKSEYVMGESKGQWQVAEVSVSITKSANGEQIIECESGGKSFGMDAANASQFCSLLSKASDVVLWLQPKIDLSAPVFTANK